MSEIRSSNWNKHLQIVEEVSQDADLSFAAVFKEGVVDRTIQMRCGLEKNKKTSGKIRIFIDRKWWFVIDAEESSKNTKRER